METSPEASTTTHRQPCSPSSSHAPRGPGAASGADADAGAPKTAAAWQRHLWVLFDDPSSSRLAKRLSLLLMSTIVISVVNFCLASQPFNCWWADGGYTTETFANSSGVFEARYLAYDPVQRWAAEVACEGAWVR